ncbi:major strawberry allergen Fra a 1.04-like [Andrographis paniculata]|uniref:major strawberry allergen Fra a 1.04-like n=1 Tax=Andrographis paniculata TaxID=175694 RepID=UPI0021E903B3|nr:major strawberry allergen Fra a 1.04-like [Andrographis paniculata]
MGVKNFVSEVKLKVSPSRIFKAMTTESNDVLPKVAPGVFKDTKVVEGSSYGPGCVVETTIVGGTNFKYKIDDIDVDKCLIKYTELGGERIGNTFEKVYHEVISEASGDGGTVIKFNSKYFAKGDAEPNDDDIKLHAEKSSAIYGAVSEYLIANPNICA